jgi:hypothetical protein
MFLRVTGLRTHAACAGVPQETISAYSEFLAVLISASSPPRFRLAILVSFFQFEICCLVEMVAVVIPQSPEVYVM